METWCEISNHIKKETYITRLTDGGDRLPYSQSTYTPNADLSTIKLFFNSVLSSPNTRFVTCDIENFYLNNLLPDPEYMKLPIEIIPNEIINLYNLSSLIHNQYLYLQINKGIYGLKKDGSIAYQALKQHLLPFGFFPTRHTPGLWIHTSRPISFCLVVDDFGIKYSNLTDLHFLLSSLKTKYSITTDTSGSLYCGISFQCKYNTHQVTLSIPQYINAVLTNHAHTHPPKPIHAPAKWTQQT